MALESWQKRPKNQVLDTDSDRRAKISHDPNNTAWSRSSTKYGQRILESQGWVPGDYLGATNAPHTSLHSAASASHVRIVLKDDNLGLGARRGARDNDNDTTTGLDVFQDLLGRLNGRTKQEVEKDQIVRSNVRRSAFVEQRWGALRFISGGFLVGDRVQDPLKRQSKAPDACKQLTDGVGNIVDDERELSADETANMRGKKERKVCCGYKYGSAELHSEKHPVSAPLEVACAAQDSDEALMRAHKAERRLKGKSRKERERDLGSDHLESPLENTQFEPQLPAPQNVMAHTMPSDNAPARTSAVICSRNAVRQRYIQHKKKAVMDSKALNEVGWPLALFRIRHADYAQILMIRS